ncbi:MAG: Fe-S cluster assembly protein HesB [Nanoarchaeota archaeon]|nr:Fe-S cluster assembly protein HesB [Nanoarchaeota archaeon]
MLTPTTITTLQKKIFTWYANNQRKLPWRTTTNPYHILVSEIMLQQTQVDRVIPYYERFLHTYPDWKSLAKAHKKDLLNIWSGLGYNNRVLRLQQTAQKVLNDYQGTLPTTEEKLITLPGIGPYTARAILAFAYNKAVPVIDTNIRRILIALLHLPETTTMKTLENYAQQLIPQQESCIWHNALMDYGALHLTAKKTGIKPLSKQSTFTGSTRQLRGKIIKLLLHNKKMSKQQFLQELKDTRTLTILQQLKKEHIITEEKQHYAIAP